MDCSHGYGTHKGSGGDKTIFGICEISSSTFQGYPMKSYKYLCDPQVI